MYQDYKDLLSVFQSHGVKYLVVGGFAVVYHSQPRFTKDRHLFIRADPENAKATHAALAEFGAPLQGIRPDDLADRDSGVGPTAGPCRRGRDSQSGREPGSVVRRHQTTRGLTSRTRSNRVNLPFRRRSDSR